MATKTRKACKGSLPPLPPHVEKGNASDQYRYFVEHYVPPSTFVQAGNVYRSAKQTHMRVQLSVADAAGSLLTQFRTAGACYFEKNRMDPDGALDALIAQHIEPDASDGRKSKFRKLFALKAEIEARKVPVKLEQILNDGIISDIIGSLKRYNLSKRSDLDAWTAGLIAATETRTVKRSGVSVVEPKYTRPQWREAHFRSGAPRTTSTGKRTAVQFAARVRSWSSGIVDKAEATSAGSDAYGVRLVEELAAHLNGLIADYRTRFVAPAPAPATTAACMVAQAPKRKNRRASAPSAEDIAAVVSAVMAQMS